MSVRATSWAWEQAPKRGISEGKLLTLLRVADHADNDGICWPGQKQIAQFTAQSDRSVRAHLSELEKEGLLHREKRGKKGIDGRGGRTTDRIILHLDLAEDASANRQDLPEVDDTTYRKPTSGGITVNREPSVNKSTPLTPREGESSSAVERALNGSKRRRDVDALRAFDAEQFPDAAFGAVKYARGYLRARGRPATPEEIRSHLKLPT